VRVSVVAAWPGEQQVVELDLAPGARVIDAVRASGLAGRFSGVAAEALELGVWSKRCAADTALREGDRVEIYRPLEADAKAMRRARSRLSPSKRSRNAP
jgi:putative ubiquitin-RnfH superfamily antitoxin RatB of RatAB toxin-antitoxin module